MEPGYPAEKAGLRKDDYILEVNGESIDKLEHDEVVKKMRAYPNIINLLVVADIYAYMSNIAGKNNVAK